MKIAAFSDSHGLLPQIDPVDVVVIAGDISPLQIQRNDVMMSIWFQDEFLRWCKDLPCERVIFTAGNHDFYFYNYAAMRAMIKESDLKDKVIFLADEKYEYDGKVFYGCPWCTGPLGWAFTDKKVELFYKLIPNCDILITHQPPKVDALGTSYPGQAWARDFGSKRLLKAIEERNIKYNFCGHIHTGTHNGIEYNGTKFYNVSLLDESYKNVFPVTYLEI